MLSRLVSLFAICATVIAQACYQPPPLYLICLLDMSGSIDTGAQASQFEALEPLFKQLKRGDTITIIPITGDALIEAQGNVLRFPLSTRRAAFDSDLRRLRREIQEKLQSLKQAAQRKPYRHTDLLGALEMASEEASPTSNKCRIAIVALSDFLQDDGQLNFTRDARLETEDRAAALARELAQSRTGSLGGASAYLGFLRSDDLKRLPEARRQALRSFWVEYLRARGAAEVRVATDGTGQLAGFLEHAQPGRPRNLTAPAETD